MNTGTNSLIKSVSEMCDPSTPAGNRVKVLERSTVPHCPSIENLCCKQQATERLPPEASDQNTFMHVSR